MANSKHITITCPLCKCKILQICNEDGSLEQSYHGARFIQCPQVAYSGAVCGIPYKEHFLLFDGVACDVYSADAIMESLIATPSENKKL